MGAHDQAIAAAQRALALAAADGDGVLHALANQNLGVAYQAQGDYRRAIDCLTQTWRPSRVHGAASSVRSSCPLCSPGSASPCAMPSWVRFPKVVLSETKGSALPRRLPTPGASHGPIMGSVCCPSAKVTWPGPSPRSNGPQASVRKRTSQSFLQGGCGLGRGVYPGRACRRRCAAAHAGDGTDHCNGNSGPSGAL